MAVIAETGSRVTAFLTRARAVQRHSFKSRRADQIQAGVAAHSPPVCL